MRIAYIVSRFPHVSETFIVRELNGVEDSGALEIELFSLFACVDDTIHPDAARWVGALHAGSVLGAFGWAMRWTARRPRAVLGGFARVAWAFRRRPGLLWRAVAALILACAHARTMQDLGVRRIHAHFATYPALAAWMCRRLTGIPYSFTAHAHDLFLDQSFLGTLVADADFVVAISAYNRDFIRAHCGSREDTPLHVVHSGVDPQRYAFRARAAAPAGPARALCIASLQEYKGHRVLFEALAAGGDDLGRVELDLVGSGELRAELQRTATQLGIAARVRFHGPLPEPDVLALLARADIFVLPSIVVARTGFMEGIPVVLMEAMAVGLPVIATRLSGVPELVIDGETGLLAEPGDAHGLMVALKRAISDDPSARRRAAAARAIVENEFDIRVSTRRMAELLKGCP